MIFPVTIRVDLEKYELEALIEWHREQKWQASEKEEFSEADHHKRRAAELSQMLPCFTPPQPEKP